MTAPAARAELWERATHIRREWLDVGLATEPADRSITEEAIASIYARHGRARPAFRWVLSPHAAVPHLAGLPTHADLQAWVAVRRPPGRPPIASDIAAGLSRLRSAIEASYVEPPGYRPVKGRRSLTPEEAIAGGLPFRVVLADGVRHWLTDRLAGAYLPARAALQQPVPVGWYGNQDASWVAYCDALRRLGLASAGHEFATWVALTRAGGWWWPGEERCVLVERPAAAGGYRDGWRPPINPLRRRPERPAWRALAADDAAEAPAPKQEASSV